MVDLHFQGRLDRSDHSGDLHRGNLSFWGLHRVNVSPTEIMPALQAISRRGEISRLWVGHFVRWGHVVLSMPARKWLLLCGSDSALRLAEASGGR